MNRTQAAKRPLADRLRALAAALPVSSSLLFFRQFLASPKTVGSVIPTSQATVDALLGPLDWARCRVFVEYGPGTGVFTRSVLARARDDAKLIAIDPNPAFVEHLKRELPDPRLHAVRGSAEDVEAILAAQGEDRADYVLSGLPFSTLPPAMGKAIVEATARAVAPGGAFLVYQYSLFVKPLLDAAFDRVEIDREWLCLPPARLMRAWRAEEAEEKRVSAARCGS